MPARRRRDTRRSGDGSAVPAFRSSASEHAKITISREGEALLHDLGSKNGTFLGSSRVSDPVALHDGDQIRLGAAVLVFRSSVEAKSTTTLARATVSRPQGSG